MHVSSLALKHPSTEEYHNLVGNIISKLLKVIVPKIREPRLDIV